MNQKDKFAKLLDEEDEFLIAILDACRYDALSNYLGEKVEKVRSLGINTQTWAKNTWDGKYDIVYISGVPFIGKVELKDYNGQEHFREVINTWSHGWDDELGTVPPESIVRDVKEQDHPRIIAHFVQPHVPHIGCDTIDFGEYGDTSLSNVAQKVEDEKLRLSYWNNLKLVWEEGVENLKDIWDGKMVVTSDHGEALGDEGYGHNMNVSVVREVPWAEM